MKVVKYPKRVYTGLLKLGKFYLFIFQVTEYPQHKKVSVLLLASLCNDQLEKLC